MVPVDEVVPVIASGTVANNTVLKNISLQEFKNEMPAADLNAIRISYISSHNNTIEVSGISKSTQDFTILTDSIKKLSNGSRSSYTFVIKQDKGERSTFKNLTIDKSESGITAFVATYRPFKEWAKKYKKNKKTTFEGKLSIEKIAIGNNISQAKSSAAGYSTKSVCDYYWVYTGSQDYNCPCKDQDTGEPHNHTPSQANICNCHTKPYTQFSYSLQSICGTGSTTVTTSSTTGGSGSSSSPYPTTATTLPPGYNPDCENGGMSVSDVGDGDGDCPLENPNPALIAKVNHLATVLNLEYFQSEILADNEWLVDLLTNDLGSYPVDDAFRASADMAISLASSSTPQINDPNWMEDVLYYAVPPEMRPHISVIKQKVKLEIALVYLQEPNLRTLTHTYPWGGTIPTGQIIALYRATREAVNLFLDIGGTIPVIGEVFDLTSGVLYTLEGDWMNAGLSFSAMIPIVGWAATTGRIAKKTITFANGKYTNLKLIVLPDGMLSFGNRKQLRTVLELTDTRQAHHLIPWEFVNNDVVQKAAQEGFHMNEALNGIPLPKEIHVEGMVHDAYNTKLAFELQKIITNKGANMSPQVARGELEILVSKIRTWIDGNPGENINNITF